MPPPTCARRRWSKTSLARTREHPGAAHYLIHAYDDPIHAPLGLRYAEAYAKIAPAASHALHMPSHIYFALGMWDKAGEMNERSVKAADERVARKGLERGRARIITRCCGSTTATSSRAGRRTRRAVLNQIEEATAKSGSVRMRSHLALARAAWLVETRKWTDARSAVDPEGLGAVGHCR